MVEIKETLLPSKEHNVLILRQFVASAIESYERLINQNYKADCYEIKTRLSTLFKEIKYEMKEGITEGEYNKLVTQLNSSNGLLILEAYDFISCWLYKKGLLKIFKVTNINRVYQKRYS